MDIRVHVHTSTGINSFTVCFVCRVKAHKLTLSFEYK